MPKLTTSSFVRSTFALIIGNGLSQVVNLLFVMVMAQVFAKDDLTIFRLGNLLIVTYAPIFVFGLPMTISYFAPQTEHRGEKKAIVWQTIGVLCFLGTLGMLLLIFFRTPLAALYKTPELAKYLPYFGINFLSEVVFSYFPFYMAAENKNKKLAISVSLISVVRILVLLFCYKTHASLETFMLLYTATMLLRLAYVLLEPLPHFKGVRAHFHNGAIKRQLAFAIPITLTNIFMALNKNLDKNLVGIFFTSQFVVYSYGAFEVPLVSVLRSSIMGAALPFFSAKYKENDQGVKDELARTFGRSVVLSSSVILPLMVCFLFFAKGLVLLMFSQKFIESAPIFAIYMLLLPTQVANFGMLLTVANKQRYIVYYILLAILTNITVFVVISQTAGFSLVALAPVVSEFLFALLITKKSQQIFGQKHFTTLIPLMRMLEILAISAVIVGGSYLLSRQIPFDEKWRTVIFAPVGFLLSFATIAVMVKPMREFLGRTFSKFLHKGKGTQA